MPIHGLGRSVPNWITPMLREEILSGKDGLNDKNFTGPKPTILTLEIMKALLDLGIGECAVFSRECRQSIHCILHRIRTPSKQTGRYAAFVGRAYYAQCGKREQYMTIKRVS